MRLLLAFIALIICLTAGAFGYLEWRGDAPSAAVEADLGGAHFSFPAAYARDEASEVGGFTDRLALVAHFPDFSPAKHAEKTPSQTAFTERAANVVLITVALKDDSIEPADRPAKLYARFLQGETEAGPGGLVLRHFETGSPYDLEELFVGPPDGRGFFARCPKARPASSIPAEMCLSMFRDGALDVELRFAPNLLAQWEALFDGARVFVGRIHKEAGKVG